ncbi:ABC transporter substrate-binding protein [Oerskovia flava]|uniref:ABC transporter substrate-binding protein n=1 Tax=Oerskovia flava TaxID=2986422 RepID=UPI00223F3B0E|nr:ABC transporter substrate-binding protein [Oerskovia sp. JB1-3-2]
MKHTRHTRPATVAVLATTAALVLSACGSEDPSTGTDGADGDLTPVTLQLQWVAQAQFAGYYAALDQGYYEEEGLDVTIQEAGTDTVPIDVLAAGEADYAISWVPKVLGSIEQGTEVTNVAQIFERSGTLQIAFADAGIDGPEDLAGKNVGSWGYGNEWELFAGMQSAGVDPTGDVSLVQQAFDMNGFLAGDIDAAQAMTYNEYAQVLETVNPDTGELYQPEDLTVIDWNDVGTAMLQDAVWADAARLADDEEYAETTVRFVKASLKGWVYARDNAQEAADVVTASGSTLGTSHQLWQTNEVNKLVWPSTSGIGTINADQWEQTVDIAMSTANETGATIITTEPPTTAYSNDYVEQAIAELEDEGVDVLGTDFAPIEVTLNEGGA